MSGTGYNKRNATLYDICKITGLSTATVSRVLNDSPLVRPETRQKVLDAAKHLGYVPSPHARALAGSQTRTLGAIFPNIANGYFAEVLEGIDEAAAEHDFHVTAAFSRNRRAEEALVERFIRERRADALVLMHLLLPQEFVTEAASTGLPIVLIDRPIKGEHLVNLGVDNINGAQQAMLHLLNLGYRRIAIVKGPGANYDAVQRFEGAMAAAQRAKVQIDPELIWDGNFAEASGRVLMREWMDRGKPLPEAVFALNDDMAIGVMDALRERGLSAPQDVAVVGFDDTETARHVQLTTVRIPMRQMGRVAGLTAMRLARKQVDGLADTVMPTGLVVRRSCGAKLGVRRDQTNDPLAATDVTLLERLGMSVLASIPLQAGEEEQDPSSQLLVNPSFELPAADRNAAPGGLAPESWMVQSSGRTAPHMELTALTAHEGRQSCRIATVGKKDGSQSLLQAVPVTPGATYQFRVWVMNDPDDPLRGSARGQLCIEWRNERGEEIERVLGPDWGVQMPANVWQRYETTAVAPRDATGAHFAVEEHDGPDAAGGAFYLDEASVIEVV